MTSEFDRRTFIKCCAAGASLALLPNSAPAPLAAGYRPAVEPAGAYPVSPVVVARSARLQIASGEVDSREVRSLLDRAMAALTGASSARDAWRSIFSADDVVAVKLNCLAGRGMSSRTEVAAAVVAGLRSAGVPDRNIILWDRTGAELERAGYTLETGRGGGGGVRCFGTDVIRGGGYEPQPEIFGEVGSCFSMVLTRLCTAVVNLPVLKDHDLAGVSGALKNNFGVIHNPNRYHDNNCDPYVAHLNSARHLVEKQRLVVCDAITPQCNSGPSYRPDWAWGYGGLLVSRDPVAADAVGAEIIEQRRSRLGLPTLLEAERPPRWLETAHEMGLGLGRLEEISRMEIE